MARSQDLSAHILLYPLSLFLELGLTIGETVKGQFGSDIRSFLEKTSKAGTHFLAGRRITLISCSSYFSHPWHAEQNRLLG